MASVASLFATETTTFVASNARTLEPNPDDESPQPKKTPVQTTRASLSFLETLEAFVCPERGVVAVDDAAFAKFVEAAVAGRARIA